MLSEAIGRQIQTLLEQRKWTPGDLASKAQVNPKKINRILEGKFDGSISVLVKIAQAFDVALTVHFGTFAEFEMLIASTGVYTKAFNEDLAHAR